MHAHIAVLLFHAVTFKPRRRLDLLEFINKDGT